MADTPLVPEQAASAKPLHEISHDDINTLTRDTIRETLHENGMVRPSWNKSQAQHQLHILKSLLPYGFKIKEEPGTSGPSEKPLTFCGLPVASEKADEIQQKSAIMIEEAMVTHSRRAAEELSQKPDKDPWDFLQLAHLQKIPEHFSQSRGMEARPPAKEPSDDMMLSQHVASLFAASPFVRGKGNFLAASSSSPPETIDQKPTMTSLLPAVGESSSSDSLRPLSSSKGLGSFLHSSSAATNFLSLGPGGQGMGDEPPQPQTEFLDLNTDPGDMGDTEDKAPQVLYSFFPTHPSEPNPNPNSSPSKSIPVPRRSTPSPTPGPSLGPGLPDLRTLSQILSTQIPGKRHLGDMGDMRESSNPPKKMNMGLGSNLTKSPSPPPAPMANPNPNPNSNLETARGSNDDKEAVQTASKAPFSVNPWLAESLNSLKGGSDGSALAVHRSSEWASSIAGSMLGSGLGSGAAYHSAEQRKADNSAPLARFGNFQKQATWQGAMSTLSGPIRDASMAVPSAASKLVISFAGQVHVFEDFSAEKANAIIEMAGSFAPKDTVMDFPRIDILSEVSVDRGQGGASAPALARSQTPIPAEPKAVFGSHGGEKKAAVTPLSLRHHGSNPNASLGGTSPKGGSSLQASKGSVPASEDGKEFISPANTRDVALKKYKDKRSRRDSRFGSGHQKTSSIDTSPIDLQRSKRRNKGSASSSPSKKNRAGVPRSRHTSPSRERPSFDLNDESRAESPTPENSH